MFERRKQSATQLIPFDLWGTRSWCNQGVVGENHYLSALQGLLPNRGKSGREEIDTTALLVPEPANRQDPNAVVVQIDGEPVGHLPREIAPNYQPLLVHLSSNGFVGRVPCRVWGGTFTDYDYRNDRLVETERFNACVTIGLAEPHLCLPLNSPLDAPHVLLPDGGAIQISGEDQHMSAITPLLRPEGESYAYASLHAMTEPTVRGNKDLVEVQLDGEPVGRLTPKMSSDLLPAIRHLEQLGYSTVAKARIKGNKLKAEVVLYCLRAHELPADWPEVENQVRAAERPLASTSGTRAPDTGAAAASLHDPIPPRPVRIVFAVPPGWPSAPEGWEPPPGWEPDPAWPLAPSDWDYWRPVLEAGERSV